MRVRQETNMPGAYLSVVNLQSGASRRSVGEDIPRESLAATLNVIEQAIDTTRGRPVIANSLPECWLTIDERSTPQKMQSVIWWVYKRRRRPVLTVGFAAHRWPGSELLYTELLKSKGPVHPWARKEPEAPWLAMREEPTLTKVPANLIPQIFAWANELGWAWIDRHKPRYDE